MRSEDSATVANRQFAKTCAGAECGASSFWLLQRENDLLQGIEPSLNDQSGAMLTTEPDDSCDCSTSCSPDGPPDGPEGPPGPPDWNPPPMTPAWSWWWLWLFEQSIDPDFGGPPDPEPDPSPDPTKPWMPPGYWARAMAGMLNHQFGVMPKGHSLATRSQFAGTPGFGVASTGTLVGQSLSTFVGGVGFGIAPKGTSLGSNLPAVIGASGFGSWLPGQMGNAPKRPVAPRPGGGSSDDGISYVQDFETLVWESTSSTSKCPGTDCAKAMEVTRKQNAVNAAQCLWKVLWHDGKPWRGYNPHARLGEAPLDPLHGLGRTVEQAVQKVGGSYITLRRELERRCRNFQARRYAASREILEWLAPKQEAELARAKRVWNWIRDLPTCPKTEIELWRLAENGVRRKGHRFCRDTKSVLHGNARCYRSVPPKRGGAGQQCCYDPNSERLIVDDKRAGTPDKVASAIGTKRGRYGEIACEYDDGDLMDAHAERDAVRSFVQHMATFGVSGTSPTEYFATDWPPSGSDFERYIREVALGARRPLDKRGLNLQLR